MTPLTDAAVARKLGHNPSKDRFKIVCWKANGVLWSGCAPKFTTSLDSITAEIEARGLAWSAYEDADSAHACVFGPKTMDSAHDDTAPLALCRALLAYLTQETK